MRGQEDAAPGPVLGARKGRKVSPAHRGEKAEAGEAEGRRVSKASASIASRAVEKARWRNSYGRLKATTKPRSSAGTPPKLPVLSRLERGLGLPRPLELHAASTG